MLEDRYGKETADLKLMGIQFLRKIWIVVIAALVGALLVGGIYYLRMVTFAKEAQYEAVSKFYIDFAQDENGVEYVYFNDTTWEDLVHTDLFLNATLEHMKTKVTKEELKEYISATLLSDTRIITSTVKTKDPKLTIEVAHALEQAFVSFGEEMKECKEIKIITSPDGASIVKQDVRTVRAAILGSVLAMFITILGMLLYATFDDSVYVPITFERRYHIPVLGVFNAQIETAWLTLNKETKEQINKDNKDQINNIDKKHITWEEQCIGELIENYQYLKKERVNLAVIGMQKGEKEIALGNCLSLPVLDSVLEQPSVINEYRKLDGLILAVEAGSKNGALIEKTIQHLKKNDCNLIGVVITQIDKPLLNAYYFGWKHLSKSGRQELS